MYRTVAGLREGAPGYKEIIIQPHPGGKLTQANADLKTYYGKILSHWKIDNDKFQLDVRIPVNTKATVYIPAGSANDILENGNPLSSVSDIKIAGIEKGYVIVMIGSGVYHFRAK
ncbi:MAG: alpha-L-rhamnosidase C-terminal domain-containing protein [Bacteroidota bacterium]